MALLQMDSERAAQFQNETGRRLRRRCTRLAEKSGVKPGMKSKLRMEISWSMCRIEVRICLLPLRRSRWRVSFLHLPMNGELAGGVLLVPRATQRRCKSVMAQRVLGLQLHGRLQSRARFGEPLC